MTDHTRSHDLEYLYKLKDEAGNGAKRDDIDKKIYGILNQHPKITAYRGRLLNAVRGGNGEDVRKISRQIKHLERKLGNKA